MSGFISELRGHHISTLARDPESKISPLIRGILIRTSAPSFLYNILRQEAKQNIVKANYQKKKKVKLIQAAENWFGHWAFSSIF